MKYRFYRSAKECNGDQAFIIEANSIQQAKELCDTVSSVFDSEDIEITHLGEAYGFEEVNDDYIPEIERLDLEQAKAKEELEEAKAEVERLLITIKRARHYTGPMQGATETDQLMLAELRELLKIGLENKKDD